MAWTCKLPLQPALPWFCLPLDRYISTIEALRNLSGTCIAVTSRPRGLIDADSLVDRHSNQQVLHRPGRFTAFTDQSGHIKGPQRE
jgi:hypothetical protein